MTVPWAEFGALALAHGLAVVSPGPDFALIVRQGLRHGRRTALWTSLGIGSGILVHTGLALAGVGLVMRQSPGVFLVFKLVGAAYLGWLGWQALSAASRPAAPGAGAQGDRNEPSPGAAWRRGFLTNVLNPKAALFFVALFPAVVAATTPLAVQIGYGLWMAVATTLWFALVATVFAHDAVRSRFLRAAVWIDRALGVVFLAFAAAVILTTAS